MGETSRGAARTLRERYADERTRLAGQVLELVNGQLTIREACAIVGISYESFHREVGNLASPRPKTKRARPVAKQKKEFPMETTLEQTFSYNSTKIRIEVKDGEPWFCLADVAKVLDLKNPRMFLTSEWCDAKGVDSFYTLSKGGNQETKFVNERNLYAMVMRSDKPEALLFFNWVVGEVLPTIRKTGGYGSALPQDYPSALRELAASVERQSKLQAEIKALEPKAEFHDKVSVAINSQTIQEVAKVLDWGPNKLFAWMRDQKMLMAGNVPYQRYIDQGYFKLVEKSFKDSHGETNNYTRTLVTGKGLVWLFGKLNRPLPIQFESRDELESRN